MDSFDMFKLMLDEQSSKILTLTADRPMNAIELAEVLGIPVAACYRRIRMLRSAGMLREESKVVSIGGKSVATYRSSVESAEVMLHDGRLRVSIRANGAENSDEIDLEETGMLHWVVPRAQDEKR